MAMPFLEKMTGNATVHYQLHVHYQLPHTGPQQSLSRAFYSFWLFFSASITHTRLF